MRVLVLTSMYPTPERPSFGTFVHEQVESLRRAGIEVEVMAFDGGGSIRNYLRAGMKLRDRLKNDRFDLVHAHYGLTGLPARMQFQCPVVLTYHGSDLLGEVNSEGKYSLSGRLKVALGKTLGFFVNQRIIVAKLLKTRLWSAEIIPMGVDMDLFAPTPIQEARTALGLECTKKYVIFVAHPDNRVKRFDVAQDAVALVSQKHPDVELIPVHSVPHEQVPQFMSAGDVLVLTSDHEASPCVIKEALANNLPIVSVRCGDVEERIEGVEGCYLCEQTAGDVAAKLELALAFGKRIHGREKVQEISLENTASMTVDVFKRAIKK